ncbi:MAG: LPXTG cell wall anchor domain-containing protein [Bacteroidetes bacterium]|nr:LPXTG cell wall anchor domain-containing protein [Bacteroidota bacterium]
MDKLTLLLSAKDLLAEGNTEQALKLIKDFLVDKPAFKKLYTEALHISSLFSKTKLEQSARTISFENAELSFGQVRKGLFNLLDFIENDETNPAGLLSENISGKTNSQTNKWLLIIGVPLILLTVAVLILVKKIGNNPASTPITSNGKNECTVTFKDATSKNFLIIPFYRPSGSKSRPEGLVIDRLAEFCKGIESFKDADFEICEGFDADRTLSFEEGARRGLDNKATIVIWGLLDEKGDKTVIKTLYKYLGSKDIDGKIPFTQMNQTTGFKDEGEQTVVTEDVLSIIASSGELTQDLENSLKLLLGMIAQLDGDMDGAITAMNAAQVSDTTASLIKYMILADNYIAKNEKEKAKVALDTCLSWNENYWLGRNNRANLQMEAGEYIGAIEDLNVALNKRPDDPDLLLTRAIAFKNSEQLYAAEKDFETVIKLKPEKEPAIRETLKATKVEIKRLEKIVEPTKIKAEQRQASKQDIIKAATASSKLGNTITKQLVTKGLEMDRNNPELIAIQVDNLLKENDLQGAKTILKTATNRNVSPTLIAKYNKNVSLFIRRLKAQNEL